MQLATWATLASICVMGAASPGPSLGVVLGNTVGGGRSAGVATGVGHGIGVGIYASLAVAGVAVVITASPALFTGLQVLGAAFLVWLAVQMLRPPRGGAADEAAVPQRSPQQGFRQGFLVAFLNPKIAAFFLALFSQFVDPAATLAEKLGMGLLAGAIDAGWYVLVALVLSGTGLGPWLEARGRAFDITMGVVLIAVAVGLVVRLALAA
jgi:threonine/homoserine/homoserine lactone efflux protein